MGKHSWLCAGVLLLCLADFAVGLIAEWPITDLQKRVPSTSFVRSNGFHGGELDPVDPPYHAAGYIHPNNTHAAKLFYYYFQERSKDPDAPLLFWTNGGPGCSSMFGLFSENGPFQIQEDLSLRWTEYGWDIGNNIVFVDQPVGTGFSYSSDSRDYTHYESEVGADMLMFFVEFLDQHPELKGKDFYLSGESYAGHYLPGIADSIYNNSHLLDLKLKGVLMGNPMTNQLDISLSYPNFAEAHGLISSELADSIREKSKECVRLDSKCQETKTYDDCTTATYRCDRITWDPIIDANPNMNYYDVRKTCDGPLCYDEHLLTEFLNDPEVQELLGVDRKWQDCTDEVMYNMYGDMGINMGGAVVRLLNAGIRFIVYAGDQDLICNWMGNKHWLDNMVWDKSSQWKGTLRHWSFPSKSGPPASGGECEVLEPLTFCKVYQAGHMVPADKPAAAFDLLHRFIKQGNFVQSDAPSAEPTDHPFKKSDRKIIVS